jgi:hypothetical protein
MANVFLVLDCFHLDDGGDFPPKCRFLQEPHGHTYQKKTFFMVTAVTATNLINIASTEISSTVVHLNLNFSGPNKDMEPASLADL